MSLLGEGWKDRRLPQKEGTGTVDEIAAAVKIGRTSARKYLAVLTVDKTVEREPAGRESRRKLPDVSSLPGKERAGKRAKATFGKSKNGRLGRTDELRWPAAPRPQLGSAR